MSTTNVIPKFPKTKNSLHSELKKRVNAYFSTNGLKPTGNPSLYLKSILFTGMFLGAYGLLLSQPAWFVSIGLCVLLGCLIAAIGFNVMHDGSHGSFSSVRWQNKIASYSMNLVGASHFMWNIKHNMIHHSFTNVDGVDDDIEIGFWMRFAPTQKHYKFHRFQHIYFGFLYIFMYLFWVFYGDNQKYFSKRIGMVRLKKMSLKEHLGYWAVKIYFVLAFVLLPIFVFGFWSWLLGFLIASFVAGFILSIVFQLAHTVEDTEFPVAEGEHHRLNDEFATHQLKTTANFATKNKTVSWLLGGLNFQVEHHLFPKISHVHYPEISKIIKEACVEYEVDYLEYPTMGAAISAHVRFLKELGRG